VDFPAFAVANGSSGRRVSGGCAYGTPDLIAFLLPGASVFWFVRLLCWPRPVDSMTNNARWFPVLSQSNRINLGSAPGVIFIRATFSSNFVSASTFLLTFSVIAVYMSIFHREDFAMGSRLWPESFLAGRVHLSPLLCPCWVGSKCPCNSRGRRDDFLIWDGLLRRRRNVRWGLCLCFP